MVFEGDEINIVSGTKAALHNARKTKFDEFYTQLPDIEKEMTHYKKCFKGKIVYCNCDRVLDTKNPHSAKNSRFWSYFYDQFERLGLKSIVCSWWDEGSGVCHVVRYNGPGRRIEVNAFKDETDGSYDGPIATKLLEACDIMVSNPPFSVFKDYFTFLQQSGKRYLIVAPSTCPTYKQVFPYLADYSCRFGYTSLHKFTTVPKDELPQGVKGKTDKKTGEFVLESASTWLTNLNLDDPPAELPLWNKTANANYPAYDNCPGAIECPTYKDIPADWKGMVGTSVSFFSAFNPKQFKIWGLGVGNLMKGIPGAVPLKEQFAKDYVAAGGRGIHPANQHTLAFYDEDGVPHVPFARVVVQLRKYVK